MILQAALPANHCTVDVQTASVMLQKNVTTRSAVARWVMSRLMVERRRRILYIRASVAELPISATTNMTDSTTVCITDSWVARGTSSAAAVTAADVRPSPASSSPTVCRVVDVRSVIASWRSTLEPGWLPPPSTTRTNCTALTSVSSAAVGDSSWSENSAPS